MIMFVLLISLLGTIARAQQLNQDTCSPSKLPPGWAPGGAITAPLKQVSQVGLKTQNPLQCSGTVVVLDGCTFYVKRFIFSGALQTQWYAGVIGTDASGNIVSNNNAVHFTTQDIQQSNGQDSANYTLIVAGGVPQYDFFVVNQLRVFDVVQNQVICTADLPYMNPNVSPLPGQSASSSGVPVPTTKGKSSSDAAGVRVAVAGHLFVSLVSLLLLF